MSIITTLQQFRSGEVSEYAALRAIAAYPECFVPTDAQSRPLMWAIEDESYITAMAMQRLDEEQPAQWMHMSGRHLLRHIPTDADGVAFELNQPYTVVISKAKSLEVALWASVVDVEEALIEPKPGQHQRFLNHRWWAVCESGHELPALVTWNDLLAVHLFTAHDIGKDFIPQHPEFVECDVLLMAGADLFELLTKLNDFDGIVIHSYHAGEVTWQAFGPNAADDLLAGCDPRPEASILRAKSIAEIHLFLDHMYLSREHRRHRMEYIGDELVARYECVVRDTENERRSYAFYPVMPLADPLDLGPGPTKILCAGVMALSMRVHLSLLRKEPSDATDEDRERAKYIAQWARELEKLLPEGGDDLPRQTIRTAKGSQYMREHPEMMTREWIVAARERADAYLPSP